MGSYKISVIGTGYVGLCTAVGFSSKGYKVLAYDKDIQKMDSINEGIPPFFEPSLKELLQKVVKDNSLKCVPDLNEAVMNTDITYITVGTPSKSDGSINLQFVNQAAKEIGAILKKKQDHLVVIKSTVVPGTTEHMVKPLLEKHSDKRCGTELLLCVNPEFLREGSAISDTLNPDRIIIGEHDERSGNVLEELYKEFYHVNMPPIIRTTLSSAELIKYANNAFLATKISFINSIANICEKVPGVDVRTIADGVGLDKRIGRAFLNAGLGYGGSCFPKDVKALIAFSKSVGCDPVLIKAVENVNANQPYKAIELAKETLGNLKGKKFAILGLAFKPNTDDIRESVAIKIIDKLLEEEAKISAYDPAAMESTKRHYTNRINYASSAIDCIKGAECCIVTTEWDEFKQLKPENFKHMKTPILIDGRRIYEIKEYNNRLKFLPLGLGR